MEEKKFMEVKKIPTADELTTAIRDYKIVQKNLKTVREALAECESKGSFRLLNPNSSELTDLGETYMKLKATQELLIKEGNRIWMEHQEFFATNPIDFTA